MKHWQPINFTTWAKDWRLAWKSNLQNYHIWLITPVWLPHDLRGISELLGWCWAEVICWLGLAILIYRHAGVLSNCFTELQNFGSAAWYQIGVHNECEMSAESKNHRKLLKIIGNGQNWSELIGNGHVALVACGTSTWSSTNGAKMRKYMHSELWSSSLC